MKKVEESFISLKSNNGEKCERNRFNNLFRLYDALGEIYKLQNKQKSAILSFDKARKYQEMSIFTNQYDKTYKCNEDHVKKMA